jgi:hypothetical protein
VFLILPGLYAGRGARRAPPPKESKKERKEALLSVGCVVSSVFVDLLLKTEQLIVFVMQVVSVKTTIYSFVHARSCQSPPQAV